MGGTASVINYQYVRNCIVLTAPFLGFVGAVAAIIFWEHGVSWLDVALLVGMHVITILGITVGYHRLFAHRTFRAAPVLRALLGIAGCMSAQGTITSWVSHHRQHHLYSDASGDIHSPHVQEEGFLPEWIKGFWNSHIGWMFKTKHWNDPFPYVNDLMQDPIVQTIDRFYGVWLLLSFLIPMAMGGAVTGSWAGALQGLIWGGAVRFMLSFQSTFCVNSLCHLWGSQPYETGDYSRNNALVSFLTLGEGWHNNHHAFPYSAQFGLNWWQVDTGWWFIVVAERLGLARDVKRARLQDGSA